MGAFKIGSKSYRAALRILICILASILVVRPGVAAPPPPVEALVYVPLSSEDALGRFEATGLPVYARLDGPDGAALLVGASTGVPTATLLGRLTLLTWRGLPAPDLPAACLTPT